ncbi:phage tail sheath subtilisin-like domain-containing protein [Nocardioides sp. STR2]|uniref:Phage tail sheath subtilisin-like domain-containing protein n=1 Tax=Nocardioides pini TaxID=2975053 RepID=A0ABT4CAF7_9ACTN|nr:phage tail sheath C-terminal domain-containing protein [Nocardioides pini]MCY4725950.1 phage tail sheath subtilisin-like domain-containing protein [Nocardioides pini]
MPEYLAPGVYTEEISTGPVPIEGVSTSTAGFVGLTERGPTTVRLVTSLRDFQRWYGDPVEPATSYLPFAVKGFFDNGGQRLFVARVTRPNAAASSLTLTTDGADLVVEAIGPGNVDDRLFVRVVPATRTLSADQLPAGAPPTPDPTRFRLQVAYYATPPPLPLVDPFDRRELRNPLRREPDASEDWDNLTKDPLSGDYVVTALQASQLVTTAPGTPGQPGEVAWTALAGGLDGDAMTAAALVGSELPPTGLTALRQIDEISLLCAPDEVNAELLPNQADRDEIRTQLVQQCEELKDRFAVLQVDRGQERVDTILPPVTSSYAAIYYPWLRVLDSRTSDTRLVPPGGHMVGIYAKTDIERGVHKAPANVEVRGIMARDLPGNRKPLEYLVNKRQHDILNPRGINVVRDFRADRRGIRVWGARTLTADAQWKYVNVRRLFIFVEESIDEGVQWVVFEPNSEPTWDRVRRSISNFLDSVWRSGALMGSLPEEAFYVRCDRSTMTQQEIDTGQLVCYIGMAPVKPAEFVVLRYSQKTADAES